MANRTLFQLIETSAKDSQAVQQAVQTIIGDKTFDDLTACAGMIENKYAEDKDQRNNRLSILRMQMRRACKALDVTNISVKKVKGDWKIIEVVPRERTAEDELDKALKLVLDNLADADVYRAVTTAIATFAAQVPETQMRRAA